MLVPGSPSCAGALAVACGELKAAIELRAELFEEYRAYLTGSTAPEAQAHLQRSRDLDVRLQGAVAALDSH